MEALACAVQKTAKLLSELEVKAGLIERKRQGLGRPISYPAEVVDYLYYYYNDPVILKPLNQLYDIQYASST